MASGRDAEDAHDLVPIQCLREGLAIMAWENDEIMMKMRERAVTICIQVTTMGVEQ